jgi:MOSC domain-containing protein YiiM
MQNLVGTLLSLQAGRPRKMEFEGKAWRSAIYKETIAGRVALDPLNIAGDKQANLKFHGGPDKAVCCFPSEHFDFWREKLGRGEAFGFGAFGENFTLQGLTEQQVCIGDTFVVGSAVVQVTQPRQPCINLARKWESTQMPAEMIAAGHSGYYLRVLTPGDVAAGDSITLRDRPHPTMSVSTANDIMYRKAGGETSRLALMALPELSEEWREMLGRRRH